MTNCDARLVGAATDYYASLLAQGKSVRDALQHARQRFAVTAGAILRENRSRHEFTLALGSGADEIMDDHETFRVAVDFTGAERYIAEALGGPVR